MANALETVFGNGFLSILGSPMFEGMGVIAFFTALVMLYPTHPALKILAFFGGCILAVPFFGWSVLILGFGMGTIIWFAVRRFWG